MDAGERIRRKKKTDKQMKCKGLSAGRLAFWDVNAYLTNIGPHMFACLMYGSLIRVLLCTWLAARAKLMLWESKNIEISDLKAMVTLNKWIGRIMEWIRGKTRANAKFLQQVWTTLSETCAKEPKAGSLAPWETIKWNA